MTPRTPFSLLICGILWFLLTGPTLAVRTQDAFPQLVDVAEEAGVTLMNESGDGSGDYLIGTAGNGAAFFDYDNDGDVDLLIVNGSTLEAYPSGGSRMVALYENAEARFTDVTQESGLMRRGWAMGACVADYDNDGYSDVYLTAYGPNVLYRNNGDGTFEEASDAGVADTHWSTNCAFGDYDRDGNVDLYVANYVKHDASVPRRGQDEDCRYLGVDVMCGPLGLEGEPDTLFRSNGDGTFTDVTTEAGIEDPGHYGFGVLFSDFDNDGWLDIYVANDSVPNFLFQNNQDGTFSEIGFVSGTAVSGVGRPESGMGVDAADYDNDGDFDIIVTNFFDETNTLYENLADMVFADLTAVAGLGQVSPSYLGWGAGFIDLDNDGFKDLFVGNGHAYPSIDDTEAGQQFLQRKEVYRNLGGTFEEVAADLGGDVLTGKSARGVAFADYDNDGDTDVVVVNLRDRPSLYRNEGGNRNHWISLRLEGVEGNSDAIGARIEIDAGGQIQVDEVRSGGSYLSHNDMRVHFGLGGAVEVDAVRIRWPNGVTEVLEAMPADRFFTVRQGEGIVARSP